MHKFSSFIRRASRRSKLGLACLSVLLWTSVVFAGERIVANGSAYAPASATGAQAMLLARRGALLDLYRNLLKMNGAQSGVIREVVLHGESWDGRIYTVKGSIERIWD